MPTLRILTNVELAGGDQRRELLATASRTLAEMLGKPESYVMIILEDGRSVCFAGSSEPAAYLELKSLGLRESETKGYSQLLCELLSESLKIPSARVYIEFASPPRHLFGWNGGTF